MSDTTVRLRVEDLRVVLADDVGATPVVEKVGFHLAGGEMLGLVGESGSGKTTVGLAMLGYARRGLRIDGGRVCIDGRDLLGMPKDAVRALRGRAVAYVPQDPASALNPALRVGTQLRETIGGAGKSDHRLEEMLVEVRLETSVLDAYPHQLSGGQQQRVALAMAFARRPSVIVLDEPTTGLDVTTQRHVLDTVRDLSTTYGVASIFVSHDLAVVGELVDRIAVMYAGRIMELGDAVTLLTAPAHPYTRGLVRALPSPEYPHTLVGIPGHPPRPGGSNGCAFAPRCDFAQERCTAGEPPLVAVRASGQHAARCIRVHEVLASDAGLHERLARRDGPDDDPAPLLTGQNVRAAYGGHEVLHGVDFALRAAECLAIVGESGSGKTTLARCCVGLHERWAGEIALHGRPVARRARGRPQEVLRAVQYIFQNPYGSLNPRRTVGEIIEQALLRFFPVPRRERDRRVVEALEAAALDGELRHRRPGDLSGGERQRVAIARALVVEPSVLVCDEITSALDVSVQAAIVEILRGLQAQRGLALLFITHNLALVRSIAGRVIVMQHGAVVEEGPTATVVDDPQAEYTRRLLQDIPKGPDGAAAAPARS